jgi:tetratricopeptide (TPR) repeat protein
MERTRNSISKKRTVFFVFSERTKRITGTILFTILCLSLNFNLSFAELKTFVKEYTYQASEIDSKVTCRTIALEQVKRMLLEEIGTYIESETVVQNYQLTKDDIKVITAGITKTEITDEKGDGKSYWIKVKIHSDPEEVSKHIDHLSNNSQLLKELKTIKNKADDAFKQIEQLKKNQKVTKSGPKKLAMKKQYEEEINKLNNLDQWEKDFYVLSEAAIDIDAERYDRAISTAAGIIRKGTAVDNLKLAYLTIGIAYRQKGMFTESVDILKKAQTIEPRDSLAYYYLGKTYYFNKTPQLAIAEFNKAIVILNEEKNILMKKDRSDYDRVMGLGSFQRDIDSCDIEIAENLAALAMSYLDISAAEIPAGTPDDAEVIEAPKETIQAFKKILEMKPNRPKLLDATVTFTGNDDLTLREIMAWCNKLIKIFPNDGRAYYVRSKVHSQMREYPQAMSDLSKAIDLDPKNPKHYQGRGQIGYEIGNYQMALKDFDKAIDLNPSDAELFLLRGAVYLGMRNFEKAVSNFKISARMGNSNAQKYLRSKSISWY